MFSNKAIKDILSRNLTRKQFLQVIAAGILSIIGLTSFLNNLDKLFVGQEAEKPNKKISSGYGNSAYGR